MKTVRKYNIMYKITLTLLTLKIYKSVFIKPITVYNIGNLIINIVLEMIIHLYNVTHIIISSKSTGKCLDNTSAFVFTSASPDCSNSIFS